MSDRVRYIIYSIFFHQPITNRYESDVETLYASLTRAYAFFFLALRTSTITSAITRTAAIPTMSQIHQVEVL